MKAFGGDRVGRIGQHDREEKLHDPPEDGRAENDIDQEPHGDEASGADPEFGPVDTALARQKQRREIHVHRLHLLGPSARAQSLSNSLIEVLARVRSSTVFTMTAQYSDGPGVPSGSGFPGMAPETTTEKGGTRP